MPRHVLKIEDGRFGLTFTDPEVTDACTATIADFDAFTCQITNGALTASPNVTQETVPGHMVRPRKSRRRRSAPRRTRWSCPTCRTSTSSTGCRGHCSSMTPTSGGRSSGSPVTSPRRLSPGCGSRPGRSAAKAGSR